MGGLGLLVASDSLTDKDYPAISMVKGDIFMIVGASLYGFSAFILHQGIYHIQISDIGDSLANATEEFFVRRSPLYEVVGQLGMWGTLINGIQAAGLEHNGMRTANWSGENSTYLSLTAPEYEMLNADLSERSWLTRSIHCCDVHQIGRAHV